VLFKDLAVRREAEEDRRREQARRVYAYASYVRVEKYTDETPLLTYGLRISNKSEELVYDCKITAEVLRDELLRYGDPKDVEKALVYTSAVIPSSAHREDWDPRVRVGRITHDSHRQLKNSGSISSSGLLYFSGSSPHPVQLEFTDAEGRR
jgi:hypothetical protein